ncbi:MAG: signal peptidase I [Planctomycetaceae bacterium]|nr:signal peptidase I [Planctomycetaceae bacterium]
MAVILLRGFVLEGYLISTGSMAPGLRGFHKRTVCPSCQFPFAFGVSFDESVDPMELTADSTDGTRKYASCPNCGQINISVSEVPVSHGDQLLVQKHVFDFRQPKRWETIVFRNPASPEEAYVKRTIGLPGEQVRISHGEVFIDGRIARKDYRTQRDMRIAVSDLRHLADSPLWEMSWDLNESWDVVPTTVDAVADPSSGSLSADDLLRQSDAEASLSFRPWRWFGGGHFVETPVSPEDAEVDWAAFLERFRSLPLGWASRVEYDRERQVLRCEGVMPLELQRDLIREATNQQFRNAVHRLAALSHLCSVTDRYGYNALISSREYPVTDLMLEATLSWTETPQEIVVEIPVASSVFRVVLSPAENVIALLADGIDKPLQTRQLPALQRSEDGPTVVTIEASNIDSQVVFAIDGDQVLVPFLIDPGEVSDPHWFADESGLSVGGQIGAAPINTSGTVTNSDRALRSAMLREQQGRWGIKVNGTDVSIRQLRMYRDVYYTPGRRRNAVEEPCLVAENSYFVMGDNSPVSADSRNWMDPFVPHNMLLGKPFLLHLPSRPAVLDFNGWQVPLRIPDWDRIRYIH